VGTKLSFVESGRRWAHSPSPSKAPGISYQGTMKTSVRMSQTSVSLTVIWCFFLFLLSTLHLALGILRCPTRWQQSLCDCCPQCWHQYRCTIRHCLSRAAFAFSCFLWRFRRAPEGFFFLWSMTGSPVSCKELSSCARVPTRGPSSECSLFHSSPSSVIKWGHRGWRVPGLVASYDIRPGEEWVYSKPRNPHGENPYVPIEQI